MYSPGAPGKGSVYHKGDPGFRLAGLLNPHARKKPGPSEAKKGPACPAQFVRVKITKCIRPEFVFVPFPGFSVFGAKPQQITQPKAKSRS